MKKDFAKFRARLLGNTGLALAGFALCAASPVFAQTAPAQAAATDEAIIVTGSRLANRGFDAPTPVTVINQEEITLSGTTNLETLLNSTPQFVASINGGATSNTVPGGNANVNLRGFGPQRNLVLVNGRRFAIQGPDQTVDLNTIPSALVKQTEVVTGGSSAVYGSDAITGVVNFIMRDDFEGVELTAQTSWDGPTNTRNANYDVTFGGNFDNHRGNAVISVDYLYRGGITRGERGEWAFPSDADGCVTPASFSTTMPGVPIAVPGGQTCAQAGGVPGLINSGSGDIPFSRISGLPAPGGPNAALNAAYATAGISGMGGFGVTFNQAGTQARPALDPQDRFNLGPENFLTIPQTRWMLNSFSHYDLNDKATAYMEFHFSSNTVEMQLAPTNLNQNVLLDVNNPNVAAANLTGVLSALDAAETTNSTVTAGSASYINAPNDGRALITLGRRFVELGDRFNSAERLAWRSAMGVRGDLGNLSPDFLTDLHYDVYYIYARTDETDHQDGNVSRSRYQAALLRQPGQAAPVCNVFGATMTPACVAAIGISATNITRAEMSNAAATLTGTAFNMPAGPVDFVLGVERRYSSARYNPDTFLSSGDVAGFNAGLPTKGHESVNEAFGEVRVPLLTDVAFADKLSFNGAFRYSDYDLKGVGGVWTYSYGLDWRVTPDVAFRGQFQHAIRAPNVGELFGGLAASNDPATDPCSNRQPVAQQTTAVRNLCIASGVPTANVFTAAVQPNAQIWEVSGGNPNVGQEDSDTTTIGVVFTPSFVPHLLMSVDHYDIRLDGAIAQLGGGLNNTLNLCFNIIQDINSPYCQAVRRSSLTGEISAANPVNISNANTGGIRTSGVDFAANYFFEMPWGLFDNSSRLNINANWSHMDEFTTIPVQAFPNIITPCLGAYGTTCGEPIPEWKGATRFTLDTGPLSLSLRWRYVGEVTTDKYLLPARTGGTVPALNTLVNPVLDHQDYIDLSFSYDVGEKLELFGGVNNALDTDPPIVGSNQVRANTWPATYDTNGQFFFLGATLKLH